jgi:hypothetical protein
MVGNCISGVLSILDANKIKKIEAVNDWLLSSFFIIDFILIA